jgi:hypothetical protein
MSPASLPFAPCTRHREARSTRNGSSEAQGSAVLNARRGACHPPAEACQPAGADTRACNWPHQRSAARDCCSLLSGCWLLAGWRSPFRALRVGPPAGPRPLLQPAQPACAAAHPSFPRAPPRCRGAGRGGQAGGAGVTGLNRQAEGEGRVRARLEQARGAGRWRERGSGGRLCRQAAQLTAQQVLRRTAALRCRLPDRWAPRPLLEQDSPRRWVSGPLSPLSPLLLT